jgi:hypothetical protein
MAPGWAQTADTTLSRLDYCAAHVRRFAQFNPQEKAWLHFDNAGYYAGDTIWFKAYVHTTLHADTTRRSRTLYVDLVAPSGRVLTTRKLHIDDGGTCHGDLPLVQRETGATGQSLPVTAGFYEVRAYTRSMLNQGTSALFSRVFPVYNAPAFPGDYTLNMSPAREAFPELRPEVEEGKALNVTFYPEGGATVVGLPCRVAYRVTDPQGRPVDTTAIFTDADGTASAVHTMHDGMGLLLYTPTADAAPTLTIAPSLDAVGGKSGRGRGVFALPKAEQSGYSLYVDNRRPEAFTVMVRATADLRGRLLGLALQQEGNLYYYDTLRVAVDGSPVVRRFDSRTLPTGVCQLTLFDAAGVVADRLLFVSTGTGTTPSDLRLSLAPTGAVEPDAVGRLDVTTTRADGTPCPTTCSVAIRDAELTGARLTAEDPRVALLLASEVRGYVHRPDYYFVSDDLARRQALDLLLMVQGWRRYDWAQMAGLVEAPLTYYREEGLVLNGYVYNRRGRRPIVDQLVHITMRNADRTLTLRGECRTDSAGNFNFLFDDFHDRWELAINLEQDSKRPREMQYRLDRTLRPELRAYAPEEQLIYRPQSQQQSETNRTAALDEDHQLGTVEIQASKRKHAGFHISLDVEQEANRLIDQGSYCPDVETFLDAMEVGFSLDSEVDTAWLNNPDSSTQDMSRMFRDQPYLWGEQANVVCKKKDDTSFRDQRFRFTDKYWPLQLPIGEIQSIDLYDIAFLRAHPEVCDSTYSDSILEAQLIAEKQTLVDVQEVLDEARRQKRVQVHALVLVTPKPLLTQRTAPKNFRLTYFDGYYTPLVFTADYSQFRPDVDEDVRRTLYWNPDVQTDSLGHAEVTYRRNSYDHSVAFSVVAAPTDGSTLPQGCNVVVGAGR